MEKSSRSRRRKPPKRSRPYRPPKKIAMPDTWEKKGREKPITEEKILPVQACGKPVTYFDAAGNAFKSPPKPTGRWDLFDAD